VNAKLAMTGEITLHGQVLPIGGVREKVMAAFRSELEGVILPKANQKDIDDIPPDVFEGGLHLHFVEHINEVLELALLPTGSQETIDVIVVSP
jgi:ATP-dependent Lon protease